MNQVMEALREDPASVRVGGTSSAGSMDHVQFLKVAQAAGIESLDQISYAGLEEGRVLAQLLGGHVDIVSAGIGDVVGLVESGDVRVLGITAEQRVGSGIVAEMPFHFWIAVFALAHGDPVDDLHILILLIIPHQRIHQDGGFVGRVAEKDPGAVGNLADSLVGGRQLGSIDCFPVFHLVYLLASLMF